MSRGGKPHLYYSINIDCSLEEYLVNSRRKIFTKYDRDQEILLVHQMELLNEEGYFRLHCYDADSILFKHKKVRKYKLQKQNVYFMIIAIIISLRRFRIL